MVVVVVGGVGVAVAVVGWAVFARAHRGRYVCAAACSGAAVAVSRARPRTLAAAVALADAAARLATVARGGGGGGRGLPTWRGAVTKAVAELLSSSRSAAARREVVSLATMEIASNEQELKRRAYGTDPAVPRSQCHGSCPTSFMPTSAERSSAEGDQIRRLGADHRTNTPHLVSIEGWEAESSCDARRCQD